jgi:hypothetical protein
VYRAAQRDGHVSEGGSAEDEKSGTHAERGNYAAIIDCIPGDATMPIASPNGAVTR